MSKNFFEINEQLEALANDYNLLVEAVNNYRKSVAATIKSGLTMAVLKQFGFPEPAKRDLQYMTRSDGSTNTKSTYVTPIDD